jgi:hypothetical protein
MLVHVLPNGGKGLFTLVRRQLKKTTQGQTRFALGVAAGVLVQTVRHPVGGEALALNI